MDCRRILAALAVAALPLVPGTAGAGEPEPPTPAETIAAAVEWLNGQQGEDGGFETSTPGTETPGVVLAIAESAQTEPGWSNLAAVNRVDARDREETDPLSAVADFTRGGTAPAAAARIITRVTAPLGLDAGEDGPFGDLVARVAEGLEAGDDVAFVDRLELALATVATGGTLPEGLADEVAAAQRPEGGWAAEGDPAGAPDLAVTGLAVDVLVAAGVDPAGAVAQSTLRFLAATQHEAGGWVDAEGALDVVGTTGAVRALRALGYDPVAPCWRTDLRLAAVERDPIAALIDAQRDNGRYVGRDDVVATSEAVHALSGRRLPIGRATDACGGDGGGVPVRASLIVLGVLGVVTVGGGMRIIRGDGSPA